MESVTPLPRPPVHPLSLYSLKFGLENDTVELTQGIGETRKQRNGNYIPISNTRLHTSLESWNRL